MAITVVDRERTLTEAVGQTRAGHFVKRLWWGFWKFMGALFVAAMVENMAVPVVGKSLGGLVGFVVLGTLLAYMGRRPLRAAWRRLQRSRSTTADASPETSHETVTDTAPTAEHIIPGEPPIGSLYVGECLDAEGGNLHLIPALRPRHTYVLGQSGTGKTTLLKRFIIQDMLAGNGLAFIDPHGDAARELLGYVPEWRMDDVIYFDPTSPTCPPFNPFALRFDPPKLTADIVSTFQMFFATSWGERLQYLLQQSILTLLVDPQERHTLSHLRRLLINDAYRAELAARVPSESLREFWEGPEFEGAKGSVPAISNKLGQFLVPMSPLERLFSSTENMLDFSAIMNEGKILIVNLSKGELGDDPSQLVGGLLVTGLQQAALARASIPEAARRPFTLFVDEFQNYVVSSFATILSEARKYRLSLVLAHQYLSQLPPALRAAIFGNVATMIAFAVSPDDVNAIRSQMRRTRISVRRRESNEYASLPDFVDYQRAAYERALADKWLGMSSEEMAQWGDHTRGFFSGLGHAVLEGGRNQPGFIQGIREDFAFDKYMAARRAEIEHALRTLDGPELTVSLLRELFGSDFEFKDTTFPDADDLQNLPPHHGFCRIERADSVIPFRSPLPPPPDDARRTAILEQQRQEARPASPPPPPRPAPPPPTAAKDDDFHFRF